MSSSILHSPAPYRADLPKVAPCLGAAQHGELLAFWALWHCRHARPPDAAPGRT